MVEQAALLACCQPIQQAVADDGPRGSSSRGCSQAGVPPVIPASPLKELQRSQQHQERSRQLWSPSQARVSLNDRFIPSRSAAARLDFSVLEREVVAAEASKNAADREDLNPAYNLLLRTELLGAPATGPIPADKAQQLEQLRSPCSPAKKLFRYKSGDVASPRGGPAAASPFATSPVGRGTPDASTQLASPSRPPRKIARAPYKVLDAPALQDDFYLNLVDWSAQNVVAVGLGPCVYLWSATTSKVTKLCDLSPADSVTSVAWSQRGSYISVGCGSGRLMVWDVTKTKLVQTLEGHRARVGAMAWGSTVLCSGSRDRSILARDMRDPSPAIAKLAGHRSEVCGLKWSPDDRQLASGGNDNQLCVWQLQAGSAGNGGAARGGAGLPGGAATTSGTTTSPVLRFTEHSAAVKALAWSPHQHGLLASGGGTADRCIRFWSTASGAAVNRIDTGSQVCNLCWSKNVNEIVSTHGYSQNQIVVWKYPSMSKLATLTGHTMRVLYLAAAPDGQTIVTGAGDETLRFWSVFPGARAPGPDTSLVSLSRSRIR